MEKMLCNNVINVAPEKNIIVIMTKKYAVWVREKPVSWNRVPRGTCLCDGLNLMSNINTPCSKRIFRPIPQSTRPPGISA